MFTLNDDLSIYATRGDIVFFTVTAEDDGKPYKFQAGDVVRIKIYGKKDAEKVALQKDFPVTEETESVEIFLNEEDTKIGEVISKPKDYWYEVELNPFTNPQTIIGYDEDGAKVFKLFPEGDDIPPHKPIKPEDIPIVDDELDMTSTRPVQNQAVARAVVNLRADFDKTNALSNETANALSVERQRLDNLVSHNVASLSKQLDYLEYITENTKAKIDGQIESDGVFATITVNLREANLIYGGTEMGVFIIPNECRPIDVGLLHTEDGLEYIIYYDNEKNHYYLSLKAQDDVTVAPSGAGSVTISYALGDYETKDIRVGADGKTYATAGEAVRDQFSVLREHLDNWLTETDNAINPVDCKNNTAFNTVAGIESENESYWVTGLIPVKSCDKLAANVLMYKCGCYDGDKNYLGVALDANDTVYKLLLSGTAYVKIQFSQSNVSFDDRFSVIVVPCLSSEPTPILVHKPHMASGYKDILDSSVSVSKLHNSYEKTISTELFKAGVLPFVAADFVIGGIDPSKGAFVADGKQRMVLKKPFFIPKGVAINFGTNQCRILYYDENCVYTGEYDNDLTSKYFDTDCYVILSIAANDNGVITKNRKLDIYNELSVSFSSDSVAVLPIGQFVFSFGLNGVTYMSDHTMIKGKLYVINASSDDHSTYAGVTVYSVDPVAKTAIYEKTILHNLGHANSIDYCEGNDCLILGNGSSDATLPGKIFILPNASDRTSWEFSDCIVIDTPNWGIKTNVVWGEHNGEQYNVAYVITNNNANVRKILLGYDNKGFSGNYVLLGEWSTANGLDVNQGTVFRNGKLYEALGHSQLWLSENTLNDNGSITQVQRKDVFLGADGSVLRNPFSEGITIENGYAYFGGSNGRIYVYRV